MILFDRLGLRRSRFQEDERLQHYDLTTMRAQMRAEHEGAVRAPCVALLAAALLAGVYRPLPHLVTWITLRGTRMAESEHWKDDPRPWATEILRLLETYDGALEVPEGQIL